MRDFLILGRISNLPTVWSNCLAAWLLAGGGAWNHLAVVCLGATFLYTGGMFLNDAVDEAFDRRYRPERPIPASRVSARVVWIFSFVWLLGGWMMFIPFGKPSLVTASSLVLAIVVYDFVHKHTDLAPVLMALCRFLLYLLAASAGSGPGSSVVLSRAAALGVYIIGLSYLARGESTGARLTRWTVVLLFVPALLSVVRPSADVGILMVVVAVQLAWTLWCLSIRQPGKAEKTASATPDSSGRQEPIRALKVQDLASVIPSGVAGLLAGIVLVDWLAAAGQGLSVLFLMLFAGALCLQRLAPAT